MKKITTVEMIGLVRENKGCTFATIETNTDPKPLKSCPFNKVEKISRLNVMIGFNYENAVNNQRTREEVEADFVASPRKWGVRKDLKTVEHKGKVYLTTATLNHFSTVYIADGKVVDSSEVAPYLPKKSEPQQGLEKSVIYRDFDAQNVKVITMNGETYEVY